ncbi:hypothetical protein ACH5RR_002589 [Cinchona calisaya]|uniref:AAA+ ATPase domain-containing protein n=1 Tax=Cinchona calisaya TaxID=153742 RepID=A0ABD3ASE3_9GENT
MAEGIAFSIAGKAAEYLINPIKCRLEYLFCYNRNIQNLREEVENLKNKRSNTQLLVDAAKKNAEVVGSDVLQWLEKVDNIKKDAGEILENTEKPQMGCFYKLLNVKSRYSMSRAAKKASHEVVKLQQESGFNRVGYPAPPLQMPYPQHQDSSGLGSRMSTRKEVMEALKDTEISTIGVCGMPGVGKTLMVQEIAAKVKVENLFDEVVMAVVSQDQDLIKLQDQIADALGLTIPEKSNTIVRAERLYKRLMHDEGKILLVLDDVWQELDLHTVGIPLQGERRGFKVLLTSRFTGVCSNMGAQKIFEVKVLPKQEAWFLFKEAAGIPDDDTGVKCIAQEVAEECRGLPLAIVVVGKALRNKEEHAWNDALQQLRNSSVTNIRGMHDLVYSRIEWSYNYLESEEAKSLLLVCSLFPEDYNVPIETLVRYGKGLQLLNDTETLSATRDRVNTITDDLKSCYLMLPGKEECVKLHDVVRDVCLSIASKDEHVYKVRHSGLKEWPHNIKYKPCAAISFTFDELSQIPGDLECPKLKFLSLICQSCKLSLPKNFFEGIKELEVLVFEKMSVELSSSLQLLTSLRTLCLDHCTLTTNLSIIGSLRRLEILSFYGSQLLEFPIEIAQLRELKSLDLRFEKGPYPLPPGVLAGLLKLEELYLGAYFQAWWDEEGDEESAKGYVREISSLKFLSTFQICTHDSQLLLHILQGLQLEKLKRFYIVRTRKRSVGQYQFRRSLHLLDIDEKLLSEPVINALFRSTDDLFLSPRGSNNLISELDEDGCANVKKLTLWSCGYKYLIDSTEFVPRSAFSNLELLILDDLRNLTEICHGNVPNESFGRLQELKLEGLRSMRYLWRAPIKPPCFGNLRTLEMSYCGSIKSLFSRAIVKFLVQLQKLDVYECEVLETVLSKEQGDKDDNRNVEFLKLEYLKLECLKSFRTFDSQIIENSSPSSTCERVPLSNTYGGELQSLFNQVMLPSMEVLDIAHLNGPLHVVSGKMQVGSLDKLRVMIVRVCENLQSIATSYSVKLLNKLELLEVYNCRALEVVFDFERLQVIGDDDVVRILPRLESLELRSLPSLKCIWIRLPRRIQAFQTLKSLTVQDCNNIWRLFSPEMAEMLVSLETLLVEKCNKMAQIIGFIPIISSSLEISSYDFNMEMIDQEYRYARNSKVVLPRLSRIELRDLEHFYTFCNLDCDLVFPSLSKLWIERCPEMRILCCRPLSAPMLRKIDLEKGQSVPFKNFDSWLQGELCDFQGACTSQQGYFSPGEDAEVPLNPPYFPDDFWPGENPLDNMPHVIPTNK